jgi:Mg2+-importing ATPase
MTQAWQNNTSILVLPDSPHFFKHLDALFQRQSPQLFLYDDYRRKKFGIEVLLQYFNTSYLNMSEPIENFWAEGNEELLKQLNTTAKGLSRKEADSRLRQQQKRIANIPGWQKDLLLLLSQYKNPLVLLLVFAVILSLILGEYSDSIIVLFVLFFTGMFGFIQERNAGNAVQKLKELVHSKAKVKRDGLLKEVKIDEVVAGDIVLLSAGDIIPADSLILEANDLHVNQSALTGESFPAEKLAAKCKPEITLAEVSNSVFKGSSVVNGSAIVLAVNAGDNTELGKIATSLAHTATESSFEKGIKNFGYLLMRVSIILVILILILNILLHKPLVDSLLFSLALAVGLTPELLPAIVTITLSAGAKRMAAKKVIVKKLSAIQNLGEMNVFCSDKTGTLTEGVVQIKNAFSVEGKSSDKVLIYARLNAVFETGFFNIIDEALRNVTTADISAFKKVDEVPYDFIRKRLSVVVTKDGRHVMITKGALKNILEVCVNAEKADETIVDISSVNEDIENNFESYSNQGFRTIAVAYKDVTDDPIITKDDETGMTFLGFILLSDPPKEGIIESISALQSLGIRLKIISGDNRLVVRHLATQIGLDATEVLTGLEMHKMTNEALVRKVNTVDVYAEVEPSQKERIIKSLQQSGNAVGYMGDGINDANALHAADVGISIDNAVDVAKEAADLVLLEKNINVISDGVKEGRNTFMNTMKYIFTSTSANFGNMFSMAVASVILPFLPLLASQVLLGNFLSDVPALTIASDNVDPEQTTTPKKWDINYIKRFMIVFGLQSSLFDVATFVVLLHVFHSTPSQFRSGWFVESLFTESVILLVIRTRRSFLKSKPSKYLLTASIAILLISATLPYMPFARVFSLEPLPATLLLAIIGIGTAYILAAEFTKQYLMKKL